MDIRKQYEINDDVWIHLGNGKLHKGKVVEYFDLGHVGRSRDIEYYVIEIDNEIEPLLEVRTWEQISQDAKGPIGAYRNLKDDYVTFKKLGKLGIEMPNVGTTSVAEYLFDDFSEASDPTPDQINAALDNAIKARQDTFTSAIIKQPKKRNYRKKNERKSGPTTL
jgi:hypothetical protein